MKHYISLGAGVQSSTMALMAAHGEITPMPDGAIFADTQDEPKGVYAWLDWLEDRLPFPVHRVTGGSLSAKVLTRRISRKGSAYFKTAIPFFMRNADGGMGRISHRTCTYNHKIVPITRALRRLACVRRGEKSRVVTSWIGISLDEMQRMKPAREPWVDTRWPLIEKRMTRNGCLEWMRVNGYPEPPRSACVFCPFRSNPEWRAMKRDAPDDFAAAVEFDRKAREVRKGYALMESTPYIHRSLTPLDEVDFRNDVDKGQLLLWQDECTGMCGV